MTKDSGPAESGAPPRSRRRFWLVVAVLCAAVAAAWYYRAHRAAAPGTEAQGPGATAGKGAKGRYDMASRPQPVYVQLAARRDVDVKLAALGTVTARSLVSVKSRVDGQLLRVLFREGQFVKSGELLAEIDPRPYQAQVDQAAGQLARDEALLKNAKLDLARYRSLLEQDSIASQQVDTQEALVRQYKGVVLADRGQLDAARLQLSFTRITAPAAGRTGLRQVDAGNMVRASDTGGIVAIAQTHPITVLFPLPQDDLPRVLARMQAGGALAVEAYDREGSTLLGRGVLLTMDNQIDSTTGTVKLKAEFPNRDDALFPNQFVNVRLTVDSLDKAIVVPSAAIQRGAPGTYVYVVNEDDTVAVRKVKLGPVQGETAVIADGLQAGEAVVTDGADKLREGAKVERKDPAASAAAGTDAAADTRRRHKPREAKAAGASQEAGRAGKPEAPAQ
ncbi:MAG: MdtA/MuxA family multidrug efflux RND transporter periplasmic adaptor subunit [Rhodocyclaceae bacterium]|nr:MdtA/MuxA family multidrug efflux RND transporter periplasmic adaptor subunit [Rhodocyclaceae bacterium]